MRTRLSICRRKARYANAAEALRAVWATGLVLRHYRCDRCSQFHLTSRTRGKRTPPGELKQNLNSLPSTRPRGQ